MALTRNWTLMLSDIGFMSEKESEHMMQGVHRVFSRGVQTTDDASIMLGVARQMLWAHRHGIPPETPPGEGYRGGKS